MAARISQASACHSVVSDNVAFMSTGPGVATGVVLDLNPVAVDVDGVQDDRLRGLVDPGYGRDAGVPVVEDTEDE